MIHKPSWFTARMKESRNCPSGRKEARLWREGPAPASPSASALPSSCSMAVVQPWECPFCALCAAGGDAKGAKGSTPGAGSTGRVDRVNLSSDDSWSSSGDATGGESSPCQLPVSQASDVGVSSLPRAPLKNSGP